MGVAHHQPIRQRTAAGSDIPDKLYFRIGEVARLCEVPAYVLRFWETEFTQLRPNKGGTGQRLFRRRDVEMALRIKQLLYDEGYTIPGARQLLKSEHRPKDPQLLLAVEPTNAVLDRERLEELRRDLRSLLAMLAKPAERVAPQRKQRPPAHENLFDFAGANRRNKEDHDR